ncbi:serine-threonine kinase [Pectobacterium phage PPWS4]|uniref:Seryl-threonyl protein kinase n=1 Tax=Pectobacterium phage PPWS4 TaxID=1961914 RepID=A0A286P064_9CAUD|nr:serine-threonine kinase [Pectobacterium phage PPWS4]BBA26419.1 seryl-threonyl protein kinase [Pectobacterium phage PPWS4]
MNNSAPATSTTPIVPSVYDTFKARMEAIKNAGIAGLETRQQDLVALLADVVAHETEGGKRTSGDTALECHDWWLTLRSILIDLGYYHMGNGHFSIAYEHRLLPKKVIKVGFKKEDSGAAYAAFCRMHQGRRGIPTIHAIERHTACYTVVMDKLMTYHSWEAEASVKASYYIVKDVIECNDLKSAQEEVWDSDSQELMETAKLIREFFSGIASFDLHSGNVMVDPDTKWLVITDPVSYTRGLDKEIFHVDPEELLKEIEALAAQRVIDKAVMRKAKRDPNGEFRKDIKAARNVRRKWARKGKAREKRQKVKRLVNKANQLRDDMLRNHDMPWRAALYVNNASGVEFALIHMAGERILCDNFKAIASNHALPIDKRLDRQFLMG